MLDGNRLDSSLPGAPAYKKERGGGKAAAAMVIVMRIRMVIFMIRIVIVMRIRMMVTVQSQFTQ